jgi:L-asparaginase
MSPVLLIHGGAGSRKPTGEKYQIIHDSLERILKRAYLILARGGSALKAVTLAAEMLEDDELYNAGLGSKIQSDGKIRMSASLMDGKRLRFSGCVNVEGVKNPIRLAEKLSRFDSRVLCAEGATRFAREKNLPFRSPYTERARLHHARQKKRYGTIGAVAIDSKGRLAAATSTGGRGYEYPQRVSDSPTIAGNYANGACAVSATGTGEQIVDFAVAAQVCTLVQAGQRLDSTARHLISKARRAKAEFGFIALDKKGHWIGLTSTPHLIWAAAHKSGFFINP